MARLGDICTFQSGGTPSKSIPSYYQGNIPWITTVSLTGGRIGNEAAIEHITDQAICESAAKIVPPNSIMVGTRVGVGKVAINTIPMSTSQDIISLLNIDESKWDKHFLCKFITAKNSYLNSQARGATIKGIKIDTLASLELPEITLEVQQHISNVIDEVQQLISLRKAQLAELDQLVKSRFIELFGDMLLNNMAWSEAQLCTLADVVSGITKGRKIRDSELCEVPYMAVSNVKDGYIDWTTVKTILASKQEIEQYRLFPYDVLMTEGGDPDKLGRGAVIINPLPNSIHQNHIFRVRLNTEMVLPIFFSYYLQQQKAKRYFLGCAKQTTGIASISMKQLRALPVLLPPIELQKKFAAFVEHTDKLKFAVQTAAELQIILMFTLSKIHWERWASVSDKEVKP